MEEYEKKFAASPVERYIREATRKGKLQLEGPNDARSLEYAEVATKELLAKMRNELRGAARGYYRAMATVEGMCKKYKALGACEAKAMAHVVAVFMDVAEALKADTGSCFCPIEEWEAKLRAVDEEK